VKQQRPNRFYRWDRPRRERCRTATTDCPMALTSLDEPPRPVNQIGPCQRILPCLLRPTLNVHNKPWNVYKSISVAVGRVSAWAAVGPHPGGFPTPPMRGRARGQVASLPAKRGPCPELNAR